MATSMNQCKLSNVLQTTLNLIQYMYMHDVWDACQFRPLMYIFFTVSAGTHFFTGPRYTGGKNEPQLAAMSMKVSSISSELKNVLLLAHIVSTTLFNIVPPDSRLTIMFNIVVNYEQCGQQNIVQSYIMLHNSCFIFMQTPVSLACAAF